MCNMEGAYTRTSRLPSVAGHAIKAVANIFRDKLNTYIIHQTGQRTYRPVRGLLGDARSGIGSYGKGS